jgi:hypothetical protein
MARIAFVSICDRNAQGQRLMSARLRQHGHECHIIFLKAYSAGRRLETDAEPDPFAWIGIDRRGRPFRYATPAPLTGRELELLREALERVRPDMIGMTVNTPLRRLNARVAQYIRSFTAVPLIWGGYDPTINPGDCLDFCDYACIGEGDAAILEIAECLDHSRPLDEVANLACRRGGRVVANRRAPLIADLDALPWRDNTPDNKYFIENDQISESYPVLNDRTPGSYQTISSPIAARTAVKLRSRISTPANDFCAAARLATASPSLPRPRRNSASPRSCSRTRSSPWIVNGSRSSRRCTANRSAWGSWRIYTPRGTSTTLSPCSSPPASSRAASLCSQAAGASTKTYSAAFSTGTCFCARCGSAKLTT